MMDIQSYSELMSSFLMATDIRQNDEKVTAVNICNPDLVMDERHKMVRNQNAIRYTFKIPEEIKITEAKKIIRHENKLRLVREKEKRLMHQAISQLEKNFSDRRSFVKLQSNRLQKDMKKSRNTVTTLPNLMKFAKFNHCPRNTTRELKARPQRSYALQSNPFLDCHNPRTEVTPINAETNSWSSEVGLTSNSGRSVGNEKEDTALDTSSRLEQSSGGENMIRENVPTGSSSECEARCINNIDEKSLNILTNNIGHDENNKVKLVTIKNSEKQLERSKKIDTFLNRLMESRASTHRNKKVKISKFNRVSNKIKTLTENKRSENIDKINEEAKNKMVRLQKIGKEIMDSKMEVQESLKKSMKRFHPSLRPKAKALATFSNTKINDDEENKARLTKLYPTPDILKLMEDRYKERKKRWEEIQKRKKDIQMEKEKIEKEREEEIRLIEKIKQKKEQEELRERRKQKKIEEERKRKERELMERKTGIAKEHYRIYLMRKLGLDPWKKLVKLRHDQMEDAIKFSQYLILKSFFHLWSTFYHLRIQQKMEFAINHHEKALLRKAFGLWMIDYNETLQMMQVAIDWYNAKLEAKVFTAWTKNFKSECFALMKMEEVANTVFERKLIKKYFEHLKSFPEFIRRQEERENRKRQWRRKIQEFLPGYRPVLMSDIM